MDLMGEDGGKLAAAFAAGCVATAGFFVTIGLWLRDFLAKGHDAEVATLKAQITQIVADRKEDNDRCAEMETRLIARIQNLEGVLLSYGNPRVRDELQARVADSGPPFNGD